MEADERFELAVEPPLSLVCFRHRGGDAVNQQLIDRLNASGKLYLTHTRLDDTLTLRMSIGQTMTQRRHVEAAWKLICEFADGECTTETHGGHGGSTENDDS